MTIGQLILTRDWVRWRVGLNVSIKGCIFYLMRSKSVQPLQRSTTHNHVGFVGLGYSMRRSDFAVK